MPVLSARSAAVSMSFETLLAVCPNRAGLSDGLGDGDDVDAVGAGETAACQVGDLTRELRLLRREALEERKRSPIEVVLQALDQTAEPVTRRPARGAA